MVTNINLFESQDSKQQYEAFVKLANENYNELKNQIKTQFQDSKEGLEEYKVNILAEHEYKEYGINIINNVLFGIFLPAIMVHLTTTVAINLQLENNNLAAALIGTVIGGLFVIVTVYYLGKQSKNSKNRKKSISLNKAILFLENYEL
ncbi:hypothetical protein [Streptococcus infantis]|uniref:Uncharacterized protein n=1 Tax=Streptococcus infantis ATCC 700779 TaxID=889204 RepID=E8JZ36_9STRE|nr:hypothetical protein [Streptococcus infantis]EFX37191.1 hypothetical protein HMPREF9423_0175 [Streptococcus infantis ATCC 700779]EIG39950.1 hypothetical protein HMPREF1111_1538 [Streptococcus infantis ATCC 700779]SUN81302.1 Uncharacterised protein [Streptococcus infantis]